MRIFYAAGPGDIIGTFDHWRRGEADPSQVAVTYSSQFYDLCERLDLEAMAIAWPCSEPRAVRDGRFSLEHRPRPVPGRGVGGWRYHLGQVQYLRTLLTAAREFEADVIIASWERHAFVFSAAAKRSTPVITSVHNTLWNPGGPEGLVQQGLMALNRSLFRHARANLVVSREIGDQIRLVAGTQAGPVREFIPTYQPGSFDDLPRPDEGAEVFRVMFAGRIERDKGVFDLLEVATRLASRGGGHKRVEFDVCGDGSALPDLQQATADAGAEGFLHLHGYCKRPRMRELYGRSHAVIVPTTTHFSEGFNKVVAEAILAGRPVVTSSACPALEYVRDAVAESPPDDIPGYVQAVASLADDPALYHRKASACVALSPQFYDATQSWGATLERVIASL